MTETRSFVWGRAWFSKFSAYGMGISAPKITRHAQIRANKHNPHTSNANGGSIKIIKGIGYVTSISNTKQVNGKGLLSLTMEMISAPTPL